MYKFLSKLDCHYEFLQYESKKKLIDIFIIFYNYLTNL